MITKQTYLLIMLIGFTGILQAQISPFADQHLLNSFLTNPAVAGIETKGTISILARRQWVGVSNAPSWQCATYHTTLRNSSYFTPHGFVNKGNNLFGNIGLGGGIFSIKSGAISQTGFHLNYAYHVLLGKGRLSFGLAPMYHQFVIDKTDFNPPDGNGPDPLIDGGAKETLHIFDVNVGVHYYSKFVFAGFSAVQLFNSAVSLGQLSYVTIDSFKNSYLARSFYLYGGVTPVISKNFSLEPSFFLKYNDISGLGFQLTLQATINRIFQSGLFYHYNESAGFLVGVRVGDFFFRYQFELPVGTVGLYQFTTNQVVIGYHF